MATHYLALLSTPAGGTKIVRCSSRVMEQAASDALAREDEETLLFGLLDRQDIDGLIREIRSFEMPASGFQRFLVLFYSHGQLFSRVSIARHRVRAVEIAAWQNQEEELAFSHVVAAFTLQALHDLMGKVAPLNLPATA